MGLGGLVFCCQPAVQAMAKKTLFAEPDVVGWFPGFHLGNQPQNGLCVNLHVS